MTYEIVVSSVARRDLHRIPPRIVPAIIEFIYGDLSAEPRRVGKPLSRDLEGSYGARRGSYRIIYDLDDTAGQVQILSDRPPQRHVPTAVVDKRLCREHVADGLTLVAHVDDYRTQ